MTDTTTCPYCRHTRPEHDQHCLGQGLTEELIPRQRTNMGAARNIEGDE